MRQNMHPQKLPIVAAVHALHHARVLQTSFTKRHAATAYQESCIALDCAWSETVHGDMRAVCVHWHARRNPSDRGNRLTGKQRAAYRQPGRQTRLANVDADQNWVSARCAGLQLRISNAAASCPPSSFLLTPPKPIRQAEDLIYQPEAHAAITRCRSGT